MPTGKILIIDDDANVTRLLQTKLESIPGISIAVTNDPKEAVSLTKFFQPDLVVCDIDMGDAWGGEVAQAINKDAATAKVPVVFLSSMVTPTDMVAKSGGRRLISKKIPLPEIIQRILQELPNA